MCHRVYQMNASENWESEDTLKIKLKKKSGNEWSKKGIIRCLMKCELEAEINNCPFYIKSTHLCANENPCSFQEKKDTQKEYIRKERWYEKYYKK